MSKHLEEEIIIWLDVLKNIMKIFLGPFLTAYFIKVSIDSMIDISYYYIFSYFLLATLTVAIAGITNNKFKIGMFRVGVILNFLYIMSILILKEKIVDHLVFVSILYGISLATYYFPYNLFLSNKINNKDRTSHTVKAHILINAVGVITPIVLGSIISATNFHLTTIIMLFISLLQIILSFLIKDNMNYDFKEYNLLHAWNRIKNKKQIKNVLLVEFFIGMNISGALSTLMTIIIFSSFKTDISLGVVNSITTIFVILTSKLYGKKYTGKDDKKLLLVCGIMPIITLLLLILMKSNVTIILYNLIYSVFTSIILLSRDIRLFNVTNSNNVNNEDRTEFLVIREFVLDMGRIVSYLTLLICGIFKSDLVLNITLVLLTLSIFVTSLYIRKTSKFEYIKETK